MGYVLATAPRIGPWAGQVQGLRLIGLADVGLLVSFCSHSPSYLLGLGCIAVTIPRWALIVTVVGVGICYSLSTWRQLLLGISGLGAHIHVRVGLQHAGAVAGPALFQFSTRSWTLELTMNTNTVIMAINHSMYEPETPIAKPLHAS